jgi:small subunit ribosomal protein S17
MKTFTGLVVSDKMDKTIVVEVAREWVHPIYKKTVKRTKKYPVHDEQGLAKVGDRVDFVETKPYSKTVHFAVSKVLEKASKITQAAIIQEEQAKETHKKA